jgi:hypothetical protein
MNEASEQRTPASRTISLAMRDFGDLAQEGHPEDALVELETLLLDREAVLARIGWLDALARPPEQPFHVEGLERIEREYAEELRLIGSGLLDAYLGGFLPEDWGTRLGRLVRDSQALWVAHKRLTAQQGAAEGDNSGAAGSVSGELLATPGADGNA